ncbi:hypothetical protein PRIPAC_73492 [Pristionchus pacificus]|uniref:Cytochrome P450 n=1 Tax=Pristionchus pacificus TaxID=54126 RepID=A0A2A6C8L2_PRIPA|nr:hypothetical protein PRIPAC_73492 [Pristionchus pacificus]|eukprot:PDM74418.1 cytochrome P450 [Pristionchus pacificus]
MPVWLITVRTRAIFYQEFTLDVICKIALGQKDVKMFENPYIDLVRNVFSSTNSSVISTVLATIPSVRRPMMLLLERLVKYHPYSKLLRDVEQAVEQRKIAREAGSPSSGDFIDIFLDAEVDSAEIPSVGESKVSRKLVFDEIVSQCIVMLLAGFETTANSLSYLTHFLANHPDVQERMREEVEAVCQNEASELLKKIEYEELAELKYMEAAIKESLRHYPLASFVVSRDCQKATTIGNVKLEVGDSVLTDTWSMHMDNDIWGEDAVEFRPERWLEDSSRPRVAFQSFGEGPRICIGMRLAFMEEKTAIVHMLKNFTIRTCERTNPLNLVGSITVAPERVDIVLEKRK